MRLISISKMQTPLPPTPLCPTTSLLQRGNMFLKTRPTQLLRSINEVTSYHCIWNQPDLLGVFFKNFFFLYFPCVESIIKSLKKNGSSIEGKFCSTHRGKSKIQIWQKTGRQMLTACFSRYMFVVWINRGRSPTPTVCRRSLSQMQGNLTHPIISLPRRHHKLHLSPVCRCSHFHLNH